MDKEKEVKKADDTVDIEEIEVGKGTKEISKENQDDFETFVQQYKGSIKEKCKEEYGSDDEKLFNDTAKEMFLDIINHVPISPTTEIKNNKEKHKEEEKMEESCNRRIKEKETKKEKKVEDMDWDERDDAEGYLRDLLDEDILSKDEFADMCIAYLSTDDLYELCRLNGILPEDVYYDELEENCSKKTEGREEYTIEELVNRYPEVAEVEFYVATVPERYWNGIHTDVISSGDDDLLIDPASPTDTTLFKEIDKKYDILDFDLMDEEEYNHTVLANGDIEADFDDWYGNKDAEVLVIVLKEKDDE